MVSITLSRAWITAVNVLVICSAVHTAPAHFDPIVVAVSNDQQHQHQQYTPNSIVTQEQQESIQVEVNAKQIPAYLLELNDSDIAGPVDYIPSNDRSGQSIIAWDLLPPADCTGVADLNIKHIAQDTSPKDTSIVRISLANNPSTADKRLDDQISRPSSQNANKAIESVPARLPTTTGRTTQRQRGTIHYTQTTVTPSTTTNRRRSQVTTQRTTTMRRRPSTTTTRTTTTTTTTPVPLTLTTAQPSDTSDYYRLEKGDSYTLPPWLAGLDYADLDVAVTFVVPTDNNEYNHTVDRDIVPPLEPFKDLNVINLPAPEAETTTPATTTRQTTTTTRRPATTRSTSRRNPGTTTTPRSYWIQTNPTTIRTRVKSTTTPSTSTSTYNNNRFTNNHNAQASTTFSYPTITVSTTRMPTHNTQTSFNTIQNNAQSSDPFSQEASNISNNLNQPQTPQDPSQQPINPFLPARRTVTAYTKNMMASTTPMTTTTTRTTAAPTTTTTTTSAPEVADVVDVEPNPFAAVLPDWLQGLDYPDLGPPVPFIYDPAEAERNVDSDLQAPPRFPVEDTAKLPNSISQFTTNQFPSQETAASVASAVFSPANSASAATTDFTSQPSSIQVEATDNTAGDTTFAANQANPQSNGNFAAPFEPTAPGQDASPTQNDVGQVNNDNNAPNTGSNSNPFLNGFPATNSVASRFDASVSPTRPARPAASPTASNFNRNNLQPVTPRNRFGGPPGILRPYDNEPRG